jgi:hypothetical protein
MLKCDCALPHLRKLRKQVSKLDLLVNIQFMATNNHKQNVHDKTHILDGQGQTAICHYSDDRLFQNMDKETGDNSWR